MRVLLTVMLLGCAVSAQAQTLTGFVLDIYIQGGGSPTVSHTIPLTEVDCTQARVAQTGTVSNPRYVRWDSHIIATNDCLWDSGATSGPLFSLPFSPTTTYEARLKGVNATGTGPASDPSNPFTRPGAVPAAPANLRIIPGS
jgi:hypothetical protein